jgi:4'-phosphopantetheinyl transferase
MTVKSISLKQVSLTKEIQLFLFDSNTVNKELLDFFSQQYLHQNEIITLLKRKKPQAQQEFVISRMLIKQLFSSNTNKAFHQIEIRFNDESLQLEVFYLDQLQTISISLSHSKGFIFLALSLNKVSLGADIEYINDKRDVNLLGYNFYHSAEIEQIKQRGKDAFYRIWTLKEALSKHIKQPVVTTLRQNIFEKLLFCHYKSGVYNDFDLSLVSEKSECSSINYSINLLSPQDFIKSFIDASHLDTKATNENI